MKRKQFVWTLALAALPATSWASDAMDLLACTTLKVHDGSFFEESLSVDEYPDVRVAKDKDSGEFTIDIGAYSYDHGSDARITQEPATGTDKHYKIASGRSTKIDLIVSGPPMNRFGKILVQEEGDGTPRHIADMACSGEQKTLREDLKPQTFESVYQFFHYEDEGRSIELEKDDVWYYQLENVKTTSDGRVTNATVTTEAYGYKNYGRGRATFECATVFFREGDKFLVEYTDCYEQ